MAMRQKGRQGFHPSVNETEGAGAFARGFVETIEKGN